MTLLVLGASSAIGSQLAAEFAAGNRLLLAGRDQARLELAARRCRERGAEAVDLIVADLASGFGAIDQAAKDRDVELVINAACATSRLRDHDLDADALDAYVMIDLVSPLRLIQSLSRHRGTKRLDVVFVSSLLAVVKSPNRSGYGGLKAVHEALLKRLMERRPERRLLILRVGVPLPVETVTGATVELGRAARAAYDKGRRECFHGLPGRMLYWLYLAQPMVFRAVVAMQRWLRRSPEKGVEATGAGLAGGRTGE